MTAPERPKLPPVVCLLGGESSGKTTLANTLQEWLATHHGLCVALVPEYLRSWCEVHQRAPLAHEQAAIAARQSLMINTAAASPGIQLVISDTSALTIAAYSELYFSDHSVWPFALQTQRSCDATLLMGLDLPWKNDGLFRDSPTARTAIDALLRRELQGTDLAFQTVYGTHEQRLHNALRALSPILTPLLGQAPVITKEMQTAGRPGWVCEACSDPECEHRMFTSLLKNTP